MNTKTITPFTSLETAIDLFHALYIENKKSGYDNQFEIYNDILPNKLIGQCITLFSLRKNGIQFEFNDKNYTLLDAKTAISTFRNIIETYLTWNHIYFYPNSESEKRVKFILWKLDGVKSMNQFENNIEVIKIFDNLKDSCDKISLLEQELITNCFFKSLTCEQKSRIKRVDRRNPNKVKAYNWKFSYDETNKKLKLYTSILPFVKYNLGSFYHDLYKYTSMYVHASYPSAAQFHRNDKNRFSSMRIIDSLNGFSKSILCLGIRDLLIQNPNLKYIFDEKLIKDQVFKPNYIATLNWFNKKTK